MRTGHHLTGVPYLSAAAFIVAVVTSIPAVAGVWQGNEVRKNGVTTVMNPAQPVDNPVSVALAEQWAADGDSDDYLFGVLTAVTTDEQGNVYLLDAQLNAILVFSPDGEFVTSIGREGEGPGEFQQPSGLFLTPQGDLAVLQRMPGKIILLKPDGMPAGTHPLPETDGMRMINDGALAGDALVLGIMCMKRNGGAMEIESSLVRVDSDGKETAKYATRTDVRDFANMEIDERTFGRGAVVWAAGPDGQVFISNDFDAYRIDVWNPDGSLEHVIEREYEPRTRTSREIEDNTPRIRVRGRGGRGGEMKVNMSKTSRAIERIYPREDGTLWVLSSRGAYDSGDGNIGTLDVFDRAGKFVRQITLEGDGDFGRDGVHLTQNRVFVVKEFRAAARAMMGGGTDEDDEAAEPMSVICYGMDLVAQVKK